MKKEDFQELISRYLAGDASAAEQRLLEAYYNRLSASASTALPSEEEEKLRRDILEQIFKKAGISGSRVIRMDRGRLKWLKYAAAIGVAILFLAVGSHFIFSPKPPKKIAATSNPVQNLNNDIGPGGNKATLILSTGQRIILDSAKSGQIARFGNTTISKTDSGKLLYAVTGAKLEADETNFNTLITPRGGIFELTLPDGTRAWLNAESRIDYPTRFADKSREVFIEGEVYFEVVKDPGRPFLVSVAARTRSQGESGHWMQIEVLGTHFNVKAYHDDGNEPVKTTLLEGSVNVLAYGSSKTIRPGQQASASLAGTHIEISDKVDLEKVMAWKNGKMSLTSSSVEQVMQDISRWYDVDIKYNGTTPRKQFYGSIHRNVPLSSVLNALKAYGVNTKLEGKTIIVE